MPSDLESVDYEIEPALSPRLPGWLKVGLLGLAGGLAAAWVYRKTLARMREAELQDVSSEVHSDSAEI